MGNQKKVLFNSDNVIINYIELVKYLIKKIPFVVVLMIVFSFLISAGKYVLDKKTVSNAQENSALVEAERDLDRLIREYELEKEYKEESIIMNLHHKEVHVGGIQVFIDVDEEIRTSVMDAYYFYLTGGSLADDVVEEDDVLKNSKYVQELFLISRNIDNVEKDTTVIDIRFMNISEDECRRYIDIIKNSLNEYNSQLQAQGIDSRVLITDEYYYITRNNAYKETQDATEKNLEDIKKKIVDQEAKIATMRGNFASASEVKISGLYVVLGAAVGVFLAIVILLIAYIFNDKIKYAKELEDRTGMMMLAADVVSEQQIGLLISRLHSLCGENKTEPVYVVGKMDERIEKKWLEVRKEAQKKNLDIQIVGNIVDEAHAIENFRGHSKVIWSVSNRDTTYAYANRLMSDCDVKNANVIGYVFFS